MLAFLVPLDAPDLQAAYDRLRNEIRLHSVALYAKPHLVVLTKRDLLPPDAVLPALDAPDASDQLAVSSASGAGIDQLEERLWTFVQAARAAETAAQDAWTGSGSPTSL